MILIWYWGWGENHTSPANAYPLISWGNQLICKVIALFTHSPDLIKTFLFCNVFNVHKKERKFQKTFCFTIRNFVFYFSYNLSLIIMLYILTYTMKMQQFKTPVITETWHTYTTIYSVYTEKHNLIHMKPLVYETECRKYLNTMQKP